MQLSSAATVEKLDGSTTTRLAHDGTALLQAYQVYRVSAVG
jgi:hypothetical protein